MYSYRKHLLGVLIVAGGIGIWSLTPSHLSSPTAPATKNAAAPANTFDQAKLDIYDTDGEKRYQIRAEKLISASDTLHTTLNQAVIALYNASAIMWTINAQQVQIDPNNLHLSLSQVQATQAAPNTVQIRAPSLTLQDTALVGAQGVRLLGPSWHAAGDHFQAHTTSRRSTLNGNVTFIYHGIHP